MGIYSGLQVAECCWCPGVPATAIGQGHDSSYQVLTRFTCISDAAQAPPWAEKRTEPMECPLSSSCDSSPLLHALAGCKLLKRSPKDHAMTIMASACPAALRGRAIAIDISTKSVQSGSLQNTLKTQSNLFLVPDATHFNTQPRKCVLQLIILKTPCILALLAGDMNYVVAAMDKQIKPGT
jgi:hypothetical protein